MSVLRMCQNSVSYMSRLSQPPNNIASILQILQSYSLPPNSVSPSLVCRWKASAIASRLSGSGCRVCFMQAVLVSTAICALGYCQPT